MRFQRTPEGLRRISEKQREALLEVAMRKAGHKIDVAGTQKGDFTVYPINPTGDCGYEASYFGIAQTQPEKFLDMLNNIGAQNGGMHHHVLKTLAVGQALVDGNLEAAKVMAGEKVAFSEERAQRYLEAVLPIKFDVEPDAAGLAQLVEVGTPYQQGPSIQDGRATIYIANSATHYVAKIPRDTPPTLELSQEQAALYAQRQQQAFAHYLAFVAKYSEFQQTQAAKMLPFMRCTVEPVPAAQLPQERVASVEAQALADQVDQVRLAIKQGLANHKDQAKNGFGLVRFNGDLYDQFIKKSQALEGRIESLRKNSAEFASDIKRIIGILNDTKAVVERLQQAVAALEADEVYPAERINAYQVVMGKKIALVSDQINALQGQLVAQLEAAKQQAAAATPAAATAQAGGGGGAKPASSVQASRTAAPIKGTSLNHKKVKVSINMIGRHIAASQRYLKMLHRGDRSLAEHKNNLAAAKEILKQPTITEVEAIRCKRWANEAMKQMKDLREKAGPSAEQTKQVTPEYQFGSGGGGGTHQRVKQAATPAEAIKVKWLQSLGGYIIKKQAEKAAQKKHPLSFLHLGALRKSPALMREHQSKAATMLLAIAFQATPAGKDTFGGMNPDGFVEGFKAFLSHHGVDEGCAAGLTHDEISDIAFSRFEKIFGQDMSGYYGKKAPLANCFKLDPELHDLVKRVPDDVIPSAALKAMGLRRDGPEAAAGSGGPASGYT